MHTWPVQVAKTRFSEFLGACLANGPQIVTRRGEKIAILVPIKQWRKANSAAQPTLKALLLADTARADLELPVPNAAKLRALPEF